MQQQSKDDTFICFNFSIFYYLFLLSFFTIFTTNPIPPSLLIYKTPPQRIESEGGHNAAEPHG